MFGSWFEFGDGPAKVRRGQTVYDSDGVAWLVEDNGNLLSPDGREWIIPGDPIDRTRFYRNQCEALRARIDRLERQLKALTEGGLAAQNQ